MAVKPEDARDIVDESAIGGMRRVLGTL